MGGTSGALHSHYAGEKANQVFSLRIMYKKEMCCKTLCMKETNEMLTIKCSHADRTVFCFFIISQELFRFVAALDSLLTAEGPVRKKVCRLQDISS